MNLVYEWLIRFHQQILKRRGKTVFEIAEIFLAENVSVD